MSELTRLARAVVEAHVNGDWALGRRIEDLATHLDRNYSEIPNSSTQFDRALESDAELDNPCDGEPFNAEGRLVNGAALLKRIAPTQADVDRAMNLPPVPPPWEELPRPSESEAPPINFDAGLESPVGYAVRLEREGVTGQPLAEAKAEALESVRRAFAPQDACPGCGRPAGIAHAYGCEVLKP